MDSVGDIETGGIQTTEGVKSLDASGGVLTIVSVDSGRDRCSSPWPHRTLALNLSGRTIDTTKYRYFSYRYRIQQAPDQGPGSISRVRWQNQSLPYWPTGRTDDISKYHNYWRTYKVDLKTVPLEVEGGNWGDFPLNIMQLVIHESHREWTSYLDWVKLTTENTATGSYIVRWNLVGGGDVLTTTLYWDSDTNWRNGLASGSTVVPRDGDGDPGQPHPHNVYLPALASGFDSDTNAMFGYAISTTGLTSGQYYYVAIKLEDGYTVNWRYSEAPVKKL
jgi:hypothetical protein